MQAEAAYNELIRRVREESLLASCADLLAWDEETMMPRGGAVHRGEQMAVLAGMQHDMATDAKRGELLAFVETASLVGDSESDEAANLREMRRAFDHATRLPRRLVQDLARTTAVAQQEWAFARRDADFKRFRPWLEKIVSLKRRQADAWGYQESPYDALLDEYEPGANRRELAALFDALRRDLVPLVHAIAGSSRRADVSIVHREYPLDRQQAFGEAAAATLGFDFRRGRLDTALHPFSIGIGPGDCRITTRYNPHDFTDAFFTILHETGHALYEQGLDPAHHGTPLGEVPSLGMHESQARLWENIVGRRRALWEYFFPLARRAFPEALTDVSLDAFHFAVNHVEPSLIRVRADEVTYNLHILIRFELEQALIVGDLRAADVPGAWNEAYRRTLGVIPANDAEGCLQDGHWASGLIGYFPTYTLGNVFSAQLFAAATRELGNLDEQFARRDFSGLLDWLREKIHRQGSRYPARKLIERVCGASPDHRPLIEQLRRKYGELYDVGV
jgi:carboxypeptidase Taq